MDDIVPDGKHLIQDIEEALQPIKDTASVYLTGSHKALPKQTMNAVFVAASRYEGKAEITKGALSNPAFQNAIKDIAKHPGVIVHISGDNESDAETVSVYQFMPCRLFHFYKLEEPICHLKGGTGKWVPFVHPSIRSKLED